MVTMIATVGLDLRRTSRYRAPNVADSIRMAHRATACSPPSALSLAKKTSLSHSHANHGAPGLVKEKMSRAGTHPWAIIHSPVRMCQPVSQSPSSVFTPSMRPKRSAMGTRKAKSASDGNNWTANWEGAFITRAFLSHPGTGNRPHGLKGSNPVVKRPEIHIINAQGDQGEVVRGTGDPHDGALTMNTFLAEAVIGRQFNFDGNDLAHRGDRELGVITTPGNENTAAADVFRVHRAFNPKRRRRNMAPKVDGDSRALASINVLHFFCFDTAEFSSVGEAHQCRKWAITLCCRSIAEGNTLNRVLACGDSGV